MSKLFDTRLQGVQTANDKAIASIKAKFTSQFSEIEEQTSSILEEQID